MRIVLLVLAGLALTGCGKKGYPIAPGPPEQIIYPRTYPAL